MHRRNWFPIALIAVATFGSLSTLVYGQAVQQTGAAEMIRQAQTIHIPLTAIQREPLEPASGLTESDLSLTIDGQSRTFQLSRPWSEDINPNTGQPQDRPNLLIILPLGVPLNRGELLKKTIADLSQQPELDWNISILDDSGNQTPYVRGLPMAIAELKTISAEKPEDFDLADWRTTAALAISSMRDLPGRRVVLTLGDIFHEVILQSGELPYEAFQIDDVETAARNAGAVVYAAESSSETERLRGLSPYYSLVGAGPWLLITKDDHPAGWLTGSIGETIDTIRHNGIGAYQIDLPLDAKQMDGQLHAVSVTPHTAQIILDAPTYYVAPRLARVRQLAALSPALRQALKVTPAAGSSPLEMVTQLAYFPHPDGKTGTQIATTGLFWNKAGPPPAKLDMALELEQANSGYVLNTTVGNLQWSSDLPLWNTALNVGPGAYILRVAAADASAKIVAGVGTSFTVEPAADDVVMISSVVLGKSCVFTAQPPVPNTVDYLRAGNCELRPNPTGQYSPQDVVWTLVRITPTGKLAGRPSKDWKASFILVDAKGSRLAEMPVRWFTTEDGSYVATTAFPLENPKLKLVDGEYTMMFRLKGPGIERDYGEDASFAVYGAAQAPPEKN